MSFIILKNNSRNKFRKYLQDIDTEIYKILLRESTEDLNKRNDIPC